MKCACADGLKLSTNGKCVRDDKWVDPFACDSEMNFTCLVSKKCIAKGSLCDGDDDCGDGSDEDPNGACSESIQNLSHLQCPFSEDYKCVGNKFQCDGTTCLPMQFLCDGKSDCYDGADESEQTCKNAPVVKCSINQFRCSNTTCISKSKRCNGVHDCVDGSDEKDCPKKKRCDIHEFRCGTGLCIAQSQVCDGRKQCLDGLDEAHCEEEHCINGREFKCAGGKSACLDLIYRCDGVGDCDDGSDESDEFCKGEQSACARSNQFMCADGKCLRSFQLCDGFADCLTGEDETECPASLCNSTTHLNCRKGKKCISKQLECDGVDDCGDGSDELHCGHIRMDAAEKRCQLPMYKCAGPNFQCISDKKLCDGRPDCEEGDDEGIMCTFNCTTFGGSECSHGCHQSPAGLHCSCPDNHYLDKDGLTCIKEDPCRFGQCSQLCIPHGSHHYCYCEDGFTLNADKFSCNSNDPQKPFLIYTNRHEIRLVQSKQPGSTPLISRLVNAIALDFKFNQNGSVSVYWSDLTSDKIYGGLIEQRNLLYQRTIVSFGVFNAEGLAVDWVTGNIYWIDSTLHSIQVASEDGSQRGTVVSENMGHARALAIDAGEGIMFWTDWEESKPRVERATLAGKDRVVIWQIRDLSQAGWPNGIALDPYAKRVYWVDAKFDSIHTISYNGQDHRVVFRDSERVGHAFGIDVYEGHVYFSDWRTNTICKTDKWVGGNVSIIERVSNQPFSLKIVHRSRQKRQLKNPCDGFKCNGICVLNGNGKAACQCTNLQMETDDGCVDISQTILIATKRTVRGFASEPPHPHAFPVVAGDRFDHIRAVSSFNNRLFVLDSHFAHIAIVNLTGPAEDEYLAAGNDMIETTGMAVDPVTGNVYVTIASDGIGRVEVMSADGKARRVLVESSMLSGMKQPRDIVYSNTTKKVYWFDDSTKPPSMFAMTSAGDNPMKLNINTTLLEKVFNPIADYQSTRLYWISDGRVVSYDSSIEEAKEVDIPGGDGNVSSIAVDINGEILIGEYVGIANQTTIRRLKLTGLKAAQRGTVMMIPILSSDKFFLSIVPTEPRAVVPTPESCKSCESLCLSSSKDKFECVCSQGFFMDNGKCRSPDKRVFFVTDDGALRSVGWYKDPKSGKRNQLMRAHSLHNEIGKKRIVKLVVDAKKDLVRTNL